MSEFSESYHLFTRNQSDAADLVKASGLKGFISKPQNGWVSLVIDEGEFEPDSRIVEKNRGVLLHFVNAEDHGWSFCLFDDGATVCRYSCSWNDEVESDMSGFQLAEIERLLGKEIADRVRALGPQFTPISLDDVFERETAYDFAIALGLPHYEWFCYPADRDNDRYAGFIKVGL